MQFEILMLVTQSIIVGLCLFCANLLMLRRRDEVIYVPLALLFLFQALTYLPGVILEGIIASDLSEIWGIPYSGGERTTRILQPFFILALCARAYNRRRRNTSPSEMVAHHSDHHRVPMPYVRIRGARGDADRTGATVR